jgi:hypothetical protein
MRIVVPAAAIACLLLACAGCGASGSTRTKSGDTVAIQFANCMRAHGVPAFPDPGQDKGNDDFRQSPAFASASSTCDKLQPGGNPSPPKPSKSRQLAMVKFAECVRQHGISHFPDPTLTPPASSSPVIDAAGIYFVLPPGLNVRAPAVKAALQACGTGHGPI